MRLVTSLYRVGNEIIISQVEHEMLRIHIYIIFLQLTRTFQGCTKYMKK